MEDAGFPSQSALARASGVPQPTINRILKGGGRRGPESDTLKKLAAACNVRFEWLNEGRGPMKLKDEPQATLSDAMRLKCETLEEFEILSMYRLANDTEQRGFKGAANAVSERIAATRNQAQAPGSGSRPK